MSAEDAHRTIEAWERQARLHRGLWPALMRLNASMVRLAWWMQHGRPLPGPQADMRRIRDLEHELGIVGRHLVGECQWCDDQRRARGEMLYPGEHLIPVATAVRIYADALQRNG